MLKCYTRHDGNMCLFFCLLISTDQWPHLCCLQKECPNSIMKFKLWEAVQPLAHPHNRIQLMCEQRRHPAIWWLLPQHCSAPSAVCQWSHNLPCARGMRVRHMPQSSQTDAPVASC